MRLVRFVRAVGSWVEFWVRAFVGCAFVGFGAVAFATARAVLPAPVWLVARRNMAAALWNVQLPPDRSTDG